MAAQPEVLTTVVNPLDTYSIQGYPEDPFAQGGYGLVFKGRRLSSPGTENDLAIKICTLPADERERNAVLREARFLVELGTKNIPNMLNCYAAFIYNEEHLSTLWLATEFCSGGTLKDLCGRLRPDALAYVCAALLQTLQALHANNVIHRDLKPDNVYLQGDGTLRLGDFGSSRAVEPTFMHTANSGTALYMAPERFSGTFRVSDLGAPPKTPYDFGVDVWALGMTLIECVDMDLPLENMHESAFISTMAGLSGRDALVDLLSRLTLRHPGNHAPELSGFISCCFAPQPAERPTAAQLLGHPFVRGLFEPTAVPLSQLRLSMVGTGLRRCWVVATRDLADSSKLVVAAAAQAAAEAAAGGGSAASGIVGRPQHVMPSTAAPPRPSPTAPKLTTISVPGPASDPARRVLPRGISGIVPRSAASSGLSRPPLLLSTSSGDMDTAVRGLMRDLAENQTLRLLLWVDDNFREQTATIKALCAANTKLRARQFATTHELSTFVQTHAEALKLLLLTGRLLVITDGDRPLDGGSEAPVLLMKWLRSSSNPLQALCPVPVLLYTSPTSEEKHRAATASFSRIQVGSDALTLSKFVGSVQSLLPPAAVAPSGEFDVFYQMSAGYTLSIERQASLKTRVFVLHTAQLNVCRWVTNVEHPQLTVHTSFALEGLHASSAGFLGGKPLVKLEGMVKKKRTTAYVVLDEDDTRQSFLDAVMRRRNARPRPVAPTMAPPGMRTSLASFMRLLPDAILRFDALAGAQEEGIFRLCGNDDRVRVVSNAYANGLATAHQQLEDLDSVVEVACLIKRHLMDMAPEPLIAHAHTDRLLGILPTASPAEQLSFVLNVLRNVPVDSLRALSLLGHFLVIGVASSCERNKMNVRNLSLVFAPSLMRLGSATPEKMMLHSARAPLVIEIILEHLPELKKLIADKS